MTAIFQRLHSYGIDSPVHRDDETTWTFSRQIREKKIHFVRELVREHALLLVEYSIHCAQLAEDLQRKGAAAVTKQLEEALMMAELLEYLYRNHLIVPREAALMRREQAVYRTLLEQQQYCFPKVKEELSSERSLTREIRSASATANWPRLLILRFRRLLIVIAALTTDFEAYARWIGKMEVYATPLFAYISWIFFVPRMLTNLFLLFKHVIPGFWMSEDERALGWWTRFIAHFERRWFELGNDVVWFAGGIINCFVLIGALAPINAYVSVALQAYDVVLAVIRAAIEISRLNKLEGEYKQRLSEMSPTSEHYKQLQDNIAHLQKRKSYDQKRLYLQVINTVIVMMTACFAMPMFAATPIIPFIAAVTSVLLWFAFYAAVKWVERQKPVDKVKLPSVVSQSFFKPAPDIEHSPSEESTAVLAC